MVIIITQQSKRANQNIDKFRYRNISQVSLGLVYLISNSFLGGLTGEWAYRRAEKNVSRSRRTS